MKAYVFLRGLVGIKESPMPLAPPKLLTDAAERFERRADELLREIELTASAMRNEQEQASKEAPCRAPSGLQ